MNHLQRAARVMPGGVSSPVRAFTGVGGEPVFIRAAAGAYLVGEDGRRYVDYIGGYGPHILGHGHQAIINAVTRALRDGTTFGAPTLAEVELAETICSALPAVEMVRLVSSGTEATMSALRLARAATGRERFVKFDGCYHGHGDAFLVAAGSGAATLGVPSSPGVPAALAADTLVAPYNDLAAVADLFDRHGAEIACVFVEPIAGNMGLVLPEPGFLEGLRELCDQAGALLVFDEVMTGFRVTWGGAQTLLGIRPDLTTLGKVIGGGLPVGAYAGSRELMEQMAPSGPVYQAGTLSGNPLAMAAGAVTLRALQAQGTWERLTGCCASAADAIGDAAARAGIPVRQNRVGTMFSTFFTDQPVTNWQTARGSDTEAFAAFFRAMLEHGVYLAPSQFEACFVSTAHDNEAIERTAEAAGQAIEAVAVRDGMGPSPTPGGRSGRAVSDP